MPAQSLGQAWAKGQAGDPGIVPGRGPRRPGALGPSHGEARGAERGQPGSAPRSAGLSRARAGSIQLINLQAPRLWSKRVQGTW